MALPDTTSDEHKTNFQLKTENLFHSINMTMSKYKKPQKVELAKILSVQITDAIGLMNLARTVPSLRKQYLKEAQAKVETSRFIVKSIREANGISAGYWKQLDLEFSSISKSMGAYISKIGKKKKIK